MKKVSIIIPVYKVEMYLARCLDSILNQIYTEWEAILIDDCSPDKSGEICDEYAKKDERFKVIHCEKNGGASAARNRGLDVASGDYIAFIDSDDYVTEKYLRTLVRDLENNDADISQCGFYHVVNGEIEENVKLIGATVYPVDVYLGAEAFDHSYGAGNRDLFNFLLWTKLFKKETVEGIRFKEGLRCEDVIFISEAYLKANKIARSDKRRYYYCRHDDSVMGKMQKDVKDMIRSHILAYREVAKTCDNYTKRSQTLSQAMLGKWYVSAVKHKALDGELKAMIKEDNKKYNFSKNKKIPFIKRVVLKLKG